MVFTQRFSLKICRKFVLSVFNSTMTFLRKSFLSKNDFKKMHVLKCGTCHIFCVFRAKTGFFTINKAVLKIPKSHQRHPKKPYYDPQKATFKKQFLRHFGKNSIQFRPLSSLSFSIHSNQLHHRTTIST